MDITGGGSPPEFTPPAQGRVTFKSLRPTYDLDLLRQGEAVGEGLFPSAARFNHSCLPSVGLSFDSWGCLVATAARDVKQGEEFTISYVGVDISALDEAADPPPADHPVLSLDAPLSSSEGRQLQRRDGAGKGGHKARAGGHSLRQQQVDTSRESRRKRLRDTYLFDCDCEVCCNAT